MDDYHVIPAALREHVKHAVERAREIAATGDELLTVSLVGTVEPEEKLIVVGGAFTGETEAEVQDVKDHYAEQVRKVAIDLDADFVVMLSESWTLKFPPEVESKGPDAMNVFRNFMMERFGSISGCPEKYRKDIVLFITETRNGHYLGMGDTTAHDKKPRTIGDVKFIQTTKQEGRFGSFLPPQMKGKQ